MRDEGMRVTVRFYTAIKEAAGRGEDVVDLPDDATVSTLLDALASKYGAEFTQAVRQRYSPEEGRANLQMLLNGLSIEAMQGLKTKLADGCTVAFLPNIMGG